MGFAGWYDDHVVPRLIKCACSAPGIMTLREKVVPLAEGKVFEIGCGGGINQQYYDPARVTAYTGMDPSAKGLDYARMAAAQKGWEADFRQGVGEAIPFADESFDTVVCTFTLCSVADQMRTLAELRRVLKPGGKLLYAEHGHSRNLAVAKWQGRIEPVWKRIAGGCHLTREVMAAIEVSGFTVHSLGERFMPRMPRWAGWMEWGQAARRG